MHPSRLKYRRHLLVLVTIGLVGYLDFLTGIEVGFFVFYFIPIAYASWYLGRVAAFAIPLLCAAVWYAVDVLSEHTYTFFLLGIWNGLVRLAAFLLMGITTFKVRFLLNRERELTARLQGAMAQIRELRGLLPTCAACKRIKNEAGEWEQMESFISRHSPAEFSHSICPACAQKLYPEVYDRRQPERPSAGPDSQAEK